MTVHILLTGATRGIGAATRALLEARGARLFAAGSRDADLSDPAGPQKLWDLALDRLDGRVDVLINNAGIFERTPISLPDADWTEGWERTLRINLDAAAQLCRFAVRHWLNANRSGRIVNVASRAGHRGDSPDHWHYAASKGALLALTKTLARGYAGQGILAFAVAPGFTMTGMADDYLASRGGPALLADIPLGRVATPEEIAEAIRWLALEAPASLTGATLDLNGASYVR